MNELCGRELGFFRSFAVMNELRGRELSFVCSFAVMDELRGGELELLCVSTTSSTGGMLFVTFRTLAVGTVSGRRRRRATKPLGLSPGEVMIAAPLCASTFMVQGTMHCIFCARPLVAEKYRRHATRL